MITDPELVEICKSTLRAFSDFFTGKEIIARFFPYLGLTHSIRRRDATWEIRISDHCRHAPREVLESIAILLAAKIVHAKPSPLARSRYEAFRRDPGVIARVNSRRRLQGRKQIGRVDGKHHSLAEIYRELNEKYFNGQIDVMKLGWGVRRSWRRLGHFDPVHNTITISPVLDAPNVPRTVIAYLMYHEMLHVLYTETGPGGRQRHHGRAFSGAERAFPHYDLARRFLSEFCRTRGKHRGN